jgi:two-component system NtrC family sensor kinase
VSYGIAQQHRGRLTVESRPGQTVFMLELPVDASPADTDAAVASVEPVDGRGRRVLVVEDEPSVRDFIVVLLEETGWRVDTAAGGRAALARLAEEPYALVVSDLRMPDGTGEELYRGAIAHDPTLAERFVFITGDTANPAVWSFVEGASAPVLEKPFPNTAFLDAVRRVVTREDH